MRINRKKLGMIFTGTSIAGVITTSVISGIRAPKFKDYLAEEEDTKLGIAKAAIKTHYPTFISGALTIGSIIMAEGVNLKEIAALGGAVIYLAKQRDEILRAVPRTKSSDAKIKETFDEEKEAEIRYLVKAGPSVEETGRGDILCLEGYSGRWFRSSEENVNRAIKDLRDAFDRGESICLNDFYVNLGITQTHFGHDWGWVSNPDYYDEAPYIEATYMDTGTFLMSPVDEYLGLPMGEQVYNDEPILVIDIFTYPMQCWMEV